MIKFSLQIIEKTAALPKRTQIKKWLETALADYAQDAEICIRIVNEQESAELNHQFRKKNYATNVLSFPAVTPGDIAAENTYLGDLVLCPAVIIREAQEQNKILEHHWAHLIIHGTLHLLGFDHIIEKDAEIMEALEIKLLQQLNYPNPYEEHETL